MTNAATTYELFEHGNSGWGVRKLRNGVEVTRTLTRMTKKAAARVLRALRPATVAELEAMTREELIDYIVPEAV